jgi:hypothetical protein
MQLKYVPTTKPSRLEINRETNIHIEHEPLGSFRGKDDIGRKHEGGQRKGGGRNNLGDDFRGGDVCGIDQHARESGARNGAGAACVFGYASKWEE